MALFAGCAPAAAWFPHGTGLPTPAGCTKASTVDLAGTPTDCLSATQHPSFLWTAFFDTEANGGVRGSGQSAYFYNDATLTYDIACVNVGCGYDTTALVNDPKDASFSASAGSITAGVLIVSPGNVDANGGNIAVGQYIGTGGTAPTISSPKITANLTASTWQLDQNVTVASATVTGTRFPQIGCAYTATLAGVSSGPIVNCPTTSDTTTASLIAGYDNSLHAGTSWRIVQGSGGGATGVAGPITFTNNKFTCNTAAGQGGILAPLGVHFDFYVTHNEFDGGAFTTCTTGGLGTGTKLFNQDIGTTSAHLIFDFEWNYVHDLPGDGLNGLGDYTSMTIANNAFTGFNLLGIDHGAVYANSMRKPVDSYIYKHNICVYPTASIQQEGTTCFSYLANASQYTLSGIGDAELLGNIAISNCHGGACNGTNWTNTLGLMSNVDPPYYGTFVSKGNLVDATGTTGGAIYKGGPNRGTVTAQIGAASGGFATVTVATMNDYWAPGSHLHVNNTPTLFNGTITSNHDGTGALVLSTPVSLGSTSAVAGILVPGGMYISASADTSHYTVKNCRGTTDDLLTAPHQAMYSAFTVLPYGTNGTTGTGLNTGTYAVCSNGGADIQRSTWTRFNPTILSYPPSVNAGNDFLITTGTGTYLGSKDWSSGIAP